MISHNQQLNMNEIIECIYDISAYSGLGLDGVVLAMKQSEQDISYPGFTYFDSHLDFFESNSNSPLCSCCKIPLVQSPCICTSRHSNNLQLLLH